MIFHMLSNVLYWELRQAQSKGRSWGRVEQEVMFLPELGDGGIDREAVVGEELRGEGGGDL